MSRAPSIVPCLTWVKRGAAKRNPDKVQLDKEDLKKLIDEAQDWLEDNEDETWENAHVNSDSEKDSEKAKNENDKRVKNRKDHTFEEKEHDDVVLKYNLEDYDGDDDNNKDKNPLSGIGGLAQYATNEDDPYITLKDDKDSDEEDDEIKPTDNLIVCGRHKDDSCVLEVHVYNEVLGNFYIHHDYLLSSFPLAVEWLNYDIADGSMGNFLALGTMEPVIEIWDLDVLEALEPAGILGSKPQKKKKKLKKKEVISGHTDAILDLSWNHNIRNVLASASADYTIAVWDLSESKPAVTLKQHTEKVQCVMWHPREAQTLLSGSFDHTAKVFDCRSPDDSHKSWSTEGEVEQVAWNNHNPLQFLASTDKGMIYCMDIRHDKPVFSLSAHDKAVTGLSFSSQIPGLLVTTSDDKHMKVWDIQEDKPSLILSRNLRMNNLHCVGCCPESPFVFAFGGERDLKVWDIRESAAVRKHFLNRMPIHLAQECQGDEADICKDDEDTAGALERLNMDEDEEEEEALGLPTLKVNPLKKKKKKKKSKKKKLDL